MRLLGVFAIGQAQTAGVEVVVERPAAEGGQGLHGRKEGVAEQEEHGRFDENAEGVWVICHWSFVPHPLSLVLRPLSLY